MDRDRFDALARLLATSGSRRVTLGALLGVLVRPTAAEAARKRRGGKDHDNDRDRDRSRDRNRARDQALQTEGRGKKRRHKKKKRRGGNNTGGQPLPTDCCGTRSCAAPEPGSTRSQCDFAGRFFAAHDLNGSIFRGIDGREADFTAADLHGSIFAEACLQGASFRSARLDGSTWGDACLFGADFTGADLGGDAPLFNEARFCDTTMPDGSINDRDCGRETACCRAGLGGDACQSSANCSDGLICCSGHCCPGDFCCGPACCDEGETCCGGFCCDCCDEGQCC
jgi:hypothetical protein